MLTLLLFLLNNLASRRVGSYVYLTDQYEYWRETAAQYPQSPDILYNAAVSAYKLGFEGEAKSYITKALIVDPLFIEAKQLQKVVEK